MLLNIWDRVRVSGIIVDGRIMWMVVCVLHYVLEKDTVIGGYRVI